MKPFHTIAVPHSDILQGKLTMNVFAADLWEVFKNRDKCPEEYKNADLFFQKTYLTQGLKNLLEVVQQRIEGKGGDPVIQIKTPFGGGKTHSLIAMYHKAKEWGAKVVVLSGTALKAKDVLWEIMEEQLTGKVEKLKGNTSPGKEALIQLLSNNQPILILIDELLEYATKAAGVKVVGNTLADQTKAFMQELSEAASSLEKVSLVVTLPASITEKFDVDAEKVFEQFEKITGRVEKIYTPVGENEVSRIIRRRLFSSIDENAVKKVVDDFIEYAEKEEMLPKEIQLTEYKERFLASYPFLPEVVDVFYQRWGTFSTFQRTRGILRLLSQVIYNLRDKQNGYITLADFELSNNDIRQELLKHIGNEFESVLSADITDKNSNSKKVDEDMGNTYKGLKLGSKIATCIFLYSFSGGTDNGAYLRELKRNIAFDGISSTVVAEVLEKMKNMLFYLQNVGEKYFYSIKSNLNRIIINTLDEIKMGDVDDYEKQLLKEHLKNPKIKVYIWEKESSNISDTEELKLCILYRKDLDRMADFLKSKGVNPRVYKNSIIFLYPLDTERVGFVNEIKYKLACEQIRRDSNIKLSNEQKDEVSSKISETNQKLKDLIRRYYRLIIVPSKDGGYKEFDMGIPTFGDRRDLTLAVYETLKRENEIIEKLAPIVIQTKFLSSKDYVATELLYQSTLKTPGEARPVSKEVFEVSIRDGVLGGFFGLGVLEDEIPIYKYYKQSINPTFDSSEILIKKAICENQILEEMIKKEEETKKRESEKNEYAKTNTNEDKNVTDLVSEPISNEIDNGQKINENIDFNEVSKISEVNLEFDLLKGKASTMLGVINFLQSKFEKIEIKISTRNGQLSKQEFEDKVEEAFRQAGIELKK